MPLYEYECTDDACHWIFEQVRRISEREDPPPCPKCAAPTARIYLPSRLYANACNIDPVVVHRAADGTYKMPGRSDAPVTAGYERVELRSIRDIERFEREVNTQHTSLIGRRVEHEQARFEANQAVRRARLRHAITHGFTMKDSDGKTVTFGPMSARGRLFAEQALKRGESFTVQSYEPGFRVDILHHDAHNREPWRDVDTGWRPVRK